MMPPANWPFCRPSADPAGIGVPNLAGSQAQALLGRLRSAFDFIVIDLPAVLPVADAAAASTLVDGVVMVVEWGRTPEDVVRECIEQAAIDPNRLLGVVLNKVELKSLPHYHAYAGTYAADPLLPA